MRGRKAKTRGAGVRRGRVYTSLWGRQARARGRAQFEGLGLKASLRGRQAGSPGWWGFRVTCSLPGLGRVVVCLLAGSWLVVTPRTGWQAMAPRPTYLHARREKGRARRENSSAFLGSSLLSAASRFCRCAAPARLLPSRVRENRACQARAMMFSLSDDVI